MGDVANAVPDELMIMDSGASKSHITSKTNLTGYNALNWLMWATTARSPSWEVRSDVR